MVLDFEYKPQNKITNRCDFLVDDKQINHYENKRHKTVITMVPQHKCLKKNKEVVVSYDCVDCEYYKNNEEIIYQLQLYITELLKEMNSE